MAPEKRKTPNNTVKIKRSKDDKIEVSGNFVFKSLASRISGRWDLEKHALESSQLVLSAGGEVVLDQVMAHGSGTVSTHYKLGKGIDGADELLLVVERSRQALFVSGIADRKPLMPVRFEGLPCSCSDGNDMALTYVDTGKTKALDLSVTDSRIANEAAGLATTMEETVVAYRAGRDTIIDDIIDIAVDIFCWLKCFWDFLLCLSKMPAHGCQQLFLFCNATCKVVHGGPSIPSPTFPVP